MIIGSLVASLDIGKLMRTQEPEGELKALSPSSKYLIAVFNDLYSVAHLWMEKTKHCGLL